MKRILLILFITTCFFKSYSQTVPISPIQVNQTTQYREPSTNRLWLFSSPLNRWWVIPDSTYITLHTPSTNAGNGLSKVGDTIIMGGTIDRNTTLDFSSGNYFQFNDAAGGTYWNFNKNYNENIYNDPSDLSGYTISNIYQDPHEYSLVVERRHPHTWLDLQFGNLLLQAGTNYLPRRTFNTLLIDTGKISLLAQLYQAYPSFVIRNTSFSTNGDNGFITHDDTTHIGQRYDSSIITSIAKLDTNWIPRWKAVTDYADSASNSINAGSGLTKVVNTLKLGGQVIGPTTLTLQNSSPIDFIDNLSGSQVEIGNSGFNAYYTDGTNESNIGSGPTRIVLNIDNSTSSQGIVIGDPFIGIQVIDNILNRGLSYSGDYSSANSTNFRWIPDKGYVDGLRNSGTPFSLTVNNSGAGTASPFTFNGSAPRTISYNSIGAQAQLNGTGFVKATGTTITYDNSTYLTSSSFVYNETPSGTINGSNVTFTLAFTPVSGKVSLYKNGLKLKPTTDYTISGGTITYVVAPLSTPTPDILLADYIK